MKISILGPVGSGKGTQSQRISQRLNWTRISTGDLVRDQIEADTPLGRKLKEDNDQGDPVPDDVVIKLALPNLQTSGGWILDDCPRTMEQARLLDKELEKRSSGLSHVIVLEGPSDDELIERITSGRRTSLATGRVYHLENDPPPDENTGQDPGPFVQRDDDKDEAIRRQIESYREEAEDIKKHYEEKGVLTIVDSGQKVSQITEDILDALGHPPER